MTSKNSGVSASTTMSSLGKACLELSKSIKGFRFSRQAAPQDNKGDPSSVSSASGTSNARITEDGCCSVSGDNDVTSGGVPDGGGGGATGGGGGGGGNSVTSTISRVIRSATNRVRAFPSSPQPPPRHQQLQQQQHLASAITISDVTGNARAVNGHSPPASIGAHVPTPPPLSTPPIPPLPPPPAETLTPSQPHTTNKRGRCIQAPVSARNNMVDVWQDEQFLLRFFRYFSATELCVLAQVCSRWRDVLYRPSLWHGVTPVVYCRQLDVDDARRLYFRSIEQRGFDSLRLVAVVDSDIETLDSLIPQASAHIVDLSVRCSNISDRGLERLLELMSSVVSLDLSGCNELTEAGLWTALSRPRIVQLSISDCINVADDTVAAIAQLLPALRELNLQAYHVTDAALALFAGPCTPATVCAGPGVGVATTTVRPLRTLRLHSCWEITNHGILNVVRTLPSLTELSLSGCSKVTDDGVEVIAENLRQLRVLDLSWCSRLSDASLEYIACDLGQLEELSLDRCCHVTDIGVGYLSTMTSLCRLYLRWCTLLRDFGLQHLYTMKNLTVLSLAGCNLLSASGVSGLSQLTSLQELELTNCPCIVTSDVCRFLRDRLPRCTVLD